MVSLMSTTTVCIPKNATPRVQQSNLVSGHQKSKEAYLNNILNWEHNVIVGPKWWLYKKQMTRDQVTIPLGCDKFVIGS